MYDRLKFFNCNKKSFEFGVFDRVISKNDKITQVKVEYQVWLLIKLNLIVSIDSLQSLMG